MSGDRTFRSAVSWSYLMDGGRQIITLLVTFVLAGIIGPAGFGLVSMALVYVMFVQMLLQQGLLPALIQRKDLEREHLDSAFWLLLGMSAVFTAGSIALSGPWAAVNRQDQLQPVIIALSAMLPVKALVLVPEAIARRALDFRTLALRTNVAAVVGGVVGVLLAVNGAGVWAIVGQQLVTAGAELAVLWTISDWRPRWRFSRHHVAELASFSVHSAIASIGVFITMRSDALLIGLFFGPTAVGIYRLAIRLVDLLVEVSVRSLQAVSLPELARFQDRPSELAARFLAIFKGGTMVAVPALGVLAAVSVPLLRLLGPEWAPATGPLRILCLVGAITGLTLYIGPLLQATGQPRQLARLTWISGIASAAAFVLPGMALQGASTSAQVTGMAWSRVAVYGVVVLTLSAGMAIRRCGIPRAALLRAAVPGVAAGVAAAAAGFLLPSSRFMAAGGPIVAGLAIGGAAALLAIGAVLATDRTLRAAARTIVRERRWGDAPRAAAAALMASVPRPHDVAGSAPAVPAAGDAQPAAEAARPRAST